MTPPLAKASSPPSSPVLEQGKLEPLTASSPPSSPALALGGPETEGAQGGPETEGAQGGPETEGTQTSLSVVVVTHNRAELALATLESARAAAEGVAVQWLVIDSGSTDGTPQAIEKRFPDIDVMRCENIGFAAANNRALDLACGRYVLLLNPDVEIASGSFAGLLAALDERPRVGMASVIQQGPEGQLQCSIRSYPSPRRAFGEALGLPWRGWREEQQDPAHYREESHADWLVGAFLIARAETIAQIGGLDERFFLYSEETDWCYRARAAGWEVSHLPHMTVTHHCTPSTRPELVAQLSYAKLLFARKHYRHLQAGAFRVALSVRHLLRVLGLTFSSARHKDGAERLAAERHALAVMIGIAQPPFR